MRRSFARRHEVGCRRYVWLYNDIRLEVDVQWLDTSEAGNGVEVEVKKERMEWGKN